MMADGGEDRLICDFAETYHILNWREIPVRTAAILARGLPDDSRTMMYFADAPCNYDRAIRAITADNLANILYLMKILLGVKNPQEPDLLSPVLLKEQKSKQKTGIKNGVSVFSSAEDFRNAWNSIVSGGGE